MSQLNKRQFLKLAVATGVVTPAFATGMTAYASKSSFTPSAGQIVINKRDGLTIHTYIAPETAAVVTSHILETDKSLYLIDCQFLQQGAAELKAYIDSLNKPLQQIMLSHPHPDHFSGYKRNFDGVDFVTTAKVAEVMDQRWIQSGRVKDLQESFGEQAAEEFVKPQSSLTTGEQDLDGITMQVDMFEDAESKAQNTFYFPEAKALIVQDLAYSNAHHFPLGNNPNWIALLEQLRGSSEAELILCGHGLPAGKGVMDDSVKYLSLLQNLLDNEQTAEAVISNLTEQYPAYSAKGITRFVNRIYKKKE